MTKSSSLLIELHYLPCIQYFVYLSSFKNVCISGRDIYSKQTYRNRCRINGPNKIENLIIPVRKASGKKLQLLEVEIDYGQKWLNNHLRSIQSAYGKAPFFDYYAEDIFKIYNKKPTLLFELNRELLTKCLEILGLDCKISYDDTSAFSQQIGHYDAREEINPKKSIEKKSPFRSTSYFQVFGKSFVENLSVIDLIFCEGPQAKQVILDSCGRENQF